MTIDSSPGKIPGEVWLRIFQAYVTQFRKPNVLDWRNSPVPFMRSAVCRNWRRIALTNSTVWDTIWITLPHVYGQKDNEAGDPGIVQQFEKCLNQVELWIKRAGNRLLSISLTSSYRSITFGFDCPAGKLVPQLVVKHASRIKELDLVISTEWYDLLSGAEFPNLQTLQLNVVEIGQDTEYGFDEEFRDAVSDTPLDLTKCPKLSVVQLHGAFEHNSIILPWVQIVDISLRYLLPNDYAQLFQQLPNLKRCALGLAPSLDDSADIDGPEEMNRMDQPLIEHLELDEMLPGTAEVILKSLPFSLKHLALGSVMKDKYDYEFLLETIPEFAQTLRSLSISHTFQDYDTILELLPQLPGLTSLDINMPNGLDDRFASLLSTPGVLTQLETIKILDSGTTRMGDQALLDMLRFRTHRTADKIGCAKLKAISLELLQSLGEAPLAQETIEELRIMLEEGLDIAVYNTSRWTNSGRTSYLL